jgi:hypothetical protein
MSAVAPLPVQQLARGPRLVKWEPLASRSLFGRCTVSFGGLIVHDIPVFRDPNTDALSVGTPSTPQLDATGHVRVREGKRQYTPILSFETKEARERWSRIVLAALADAGIDIGGAP